MLVTCLYCNLHFVLADDVVMLLFLLAYCENCVHHLYVNISKIRLTRMLANNVSIPNLTVARPPVTVPTAASTNPDRVTNRHGLTENKPSFIRKPHIIMAMSLSCRVSTISAFCWATTKTPSITNRLVAIVHAKPVIALLVPKLVAVATSLRPSSSSMSSLDILTPKTYP